MELCNQDKLRQHCTVIAENKSSQLYQIVSYLYFYFSIHLNNCMILGYSIFIVIGNLMECEADQLLNLVPAVQPVRPQLIADATGSKVRASGQAAGGAAGGTAGGSQVDEEQLKKALKESKELNEHGDTSLQRALQMSMEGLFVVHSMFYITKFFFVFIHFQC